MGQGSSNDLVFVVDRTNSMEDWYDDALSFVLKYIIRLSAEDQVNKVGLVLVDDHYPEGTLRDLGTLHIPTVQSFGLTDDLEEFAYWLKTSQIGSGADYPEAFGCGSQAGRSLSPNGRLWIVTDNLSHGMADLSRAPASFSDSFQDGCPCGQRVDPRSRILLFPSASDRVTRFVEETWRQSGFSTISVNPTIDESVDQAVEQAAALEESYEAAASDEGD